MILIYNILICIILIIGFPVILPMILLSEKRRKTVLHRLTLRFSLPTSHFPLPTSHLKPIWVHALSVGEVLSSVPLVRALKDGKKQIVFSASTATGFETARKMLADYADRIFYFPYDLGFSVKRAIRCIDPSIVVIVETDIWPNFLFAMKAQNIPVILVNARLSDRSFSRYRFFSFFTKQVFTKFCKICAQTAEDARRFAELGLNSDSIVITGNMKFDQPEINLCNEETVFFQKLTDSRKIIVAGSTHEGEEVILAKCFSQIEKDIGNLLMIIAPRDPKRAEAVRRIAESVGLSCLLLSDIEKKGMPDKGMPDKTDIIVIDRIGILRSLYALADIAFVGGSLARFGGHNPIEPAVFAKPVLFGPDMSDFRDISQKLLNSGGAIQIHDAMSFSDVACDLFKNQEKARIIGKSAFEVFSADKGAVERTLALIIQNC